jgi:hypothetical protein
MRALSIKIMSSVAGLAVLLAPYAALAAHGKAGLWQITVKVNGQSVNMPDMSKLPPEVQARMKAMGVAVSSAGVTMQHCMTPQETVLNLPPAGVHDKSCTYSNSGFVNGTMNADVTCTGKFTGTGHVRFVYDSDEHFTEEGSMTGMSGDKQITRSESMEGTWLSAQCPAGQH